MSKTLCGADCSTCPSNSICKGCEATDCKPFGKKCFVAEYIKMNGIEEYKAFKSGLLHEINRLLTTIGIPNADALYELSGSFVNLEYDIPSGKKVRFLDDQRIYLGCQIEFADMGVCYGVVADLGFILVCSYSVDGSQQELIAYKKR